MWQLSWGKPIASLRIFQGGRLSLRFTQRLKKYACNFHAKDNLGEKLCSKTESTQFYLTGYS